jgi:hypothetical protein
MNVFDKIQKVKKLKEGSNLRELQNEEFFKSCQRLANCWHYKDKKKKKETKLKENDLMVYEFLIFNKLNP